jgi:uncharacterized YccA/Bax inhibitor family protein
MVTSTNPMFRRVNLAAEPYSGPAAETMTLNGAIYRAGILLVCVIASAILAWTEGILISRVLSAVIVLICLLVGVALVWLTVRNKQWSPITAPTYALLEGFVMGNISARLEARHHGIAIQSLAITFAMCLCVLVAYRFGLIRTSDRFNAGVAVATSGVVLFYLANFALAFLGVRTLGLFSGGVPGILISVVIVIIAGLNLVTDFAFIEQCSKNGLAKYMEWYAAFGFMVTLIWLYTEILRLMSKVRKTEDKT